MKTRNLQIFSAALLVFCLGTTSCDKLVDAEPQGVIISGDFWRTESQAVGAIAGIYANLSCTNINWAIGATNANNLSNTFLTPQEAYIYWGEVRGEILATNPTKMPAAQLTKENVDSYLVAPGDATTRYGAFYKIINQANLAIKHVPDVVAKDPNFTQAESDQLVGEAYFARAFCYFWLTRAFRDVPLVLDPYEKDDQEFNVPKAAGKEILDQIVKDLVKAKETLPEWYESALYPRVRATKYTAMTTLADVYLWQAALADNSASANAMYDKVIENCKAVRESGRYFILPLSLYTSIFNTGNTPESIFEQFTNNTLNNQSSSMEGWFKGSNQLWVVSPRADLLFQITPLVDVRAGTVNANTGFNSTTRLLQKYQNNNSRWIYYRLAEVYLMEAEALAHRYPNDAAKLKEGCELINDLRQRVYPLKSLFPEASTTSTEEMDQLLLDERGREFIGEGKRWFDLVRFASRDKFARKDFLVQTILNSLSGTDQLKISPRISNPESWYLPFNTDELTNNTALVQNPYYK
ncbi:RagB/SusD family nutrient uptake outer membrane protein [Hufsiella ginkgonis]|uniref:RagB/SusD family nutrient uptake outer membrane protein n=1 Tax=Hufsiella ginkgonis TaxID=2695274 RepID=A0A7K1Y4M5_9SPHI|nr:RagB/SusD family nutrient uptake outer membrane protein [Hufsiella ginkgonis]MXV17666.1 RagB/SusD family nutrient uptake outer membrane protein [Hufsiella ginkgonis]